MRTGNPFGDSLQAGSFGERMPLVGTCVNAFDDDGVCLVDSLPWSDVSAFACAEEGARELTVEEFDARAAMSPELTMETQGREVRRMEADGVVMLHDLDVDVHYFFAGG